MYKLTQEGGKASDLGFHLWIYLVYSPAQHKYNEYKLLVICPELNEKHHTKALCFDIS